MSSNLDYITSMIVFGTCAAAYLAAQGLLPSFVSDDIQFFIWSRLAPTVLIGAAVILLRRRIHW